MAVPVTTGQLRTKISDMQIGDYLIAGFVTGNTSGTLNAEPFPTGSGWYGLTSLTAEVPFEGKTTGSGSFCWIKADKGLLIADRVLQNSISWDTLNAGKLIQGMPWGEKNDIPTMTNNTTPNGVASASSIWDATMDAYNAFDKNNNTEWHPNSGSVFPQSIAYDFGFAKTIRAYSINVSTTRAIGYCPKDWTFEGWDGSKWIVLDTQTGITNWVLGAKKIFAPPSSKVTPCTKYKLNITANNGATYCAISEIEMMETAGVIRSLTGGVAYLDVNNNRSISSGADAYRGGWPTNNEWDKYIVKSNLGGKITAGNFNVWHVQATGVTGATTTIAEWMQDTNDIAIVASTNRTYRGYNGLAFLNNNVTTASSVTMGFRPVFQYIE